MHISGSEEDIRKAKAAIDDIINNGADYRPNSNNRDAGFKSDNRDNDYSSSNSESVTMNVEQSLVGRVIGRGGATIKDIREKSGAKINIGEFYKFYILKKSVFGTLESTRTGYPSYKVLDLTKSIQ